MTDNDDYLDLYNATVGKKRREEAIKNFMAVEEQPLKKKKANVQSAKRKKVIAGIIVAVALAGTVYFGAKLPPKGFENSAYDQYIEWVHEQREFDSNFAISEETYNYFLENVYEQSEKEIGER